jgi:large subunit ribosomal protein L20
MNYSTLMHGLKKAGINLNRKMLAEIAVSDKEAFAALCAQAKAAL